jgi:2-polyprenyl-3-methyl-5-hydroxy-6-metoxy-1,4-benzoquinol methylase
MVSKKKKYELQYDPYGSHMKLVDWIKERSRVLDVGCASRYIAKKLKEKGCRITGVEVDKDLARQASENCQKVIVGDVEDEKTILQLTWDRYDVILLADVLEHLRDSKKTLTKIAHGISEKCEVLVSVPNIAFLTYRLLHLLGRFEYEESGIMDETHLRFFTRESFSKLIKESDLKIVEFEGVGNFTQLPFYMQTIYPMVGKKKLMREIEAWITKLWPEGLAVQFLFKCKRK